MYNVFKVSTNFARTAHELMVSESKQDGRQNIHEHSHVSTDLVCLVCLLKVFGMLWTVCIE